MGEKENPSREHYIREFYDTIERFNSYWYQLYLTRKLNPQRILEIGIGNKFYYNYVKYILEKEIIGIDIEESLNPDYLIDVRDTTKLRDIFGESSFDLVVSFEVLEHLPYKDALKSLKNMLMLSKKYVIFSVPDSRYTFKVSLKIPGFNEFGFIFKKHLPLKNKSDHKYHYWEIGWKNYSLKRVEKDVSKIGEIVYSHTPYHAYFHRFFIVKKRD